MKFLDLHLYASWKDNEQARRLMAKSAELGYKQVGVPFPLGTKEDAVSQLRKMGDELGLDLVTRLDLAPRSAGELLASLRRFRRSFEVVSVLCGSKAVARQAGKDRRVDLLCSVSFDPKRRFFDRAEAELASVSGAALEIDLAQVLTNLEERSSVGLFTRLRREVATAKSFGVPVVFSSGASEPLLLRKPQDYAALAYLFDVDAGFALDALSKNPAGIVERNRKLQSPDSVAPGVRVVRGMRKL